MNKFIEREKEIEKTVEEYKKHIQWNLSIELLEDAVKCLTQEKNQMCEDMERYERDIRELEDRVGECEDEEYRQDNKIRELEDSVNNMDLDDILPHGETVDDIVFTDDIDDHVKDYLDKNLEDFVKDINSKEIEEAVDTRLNDQAGNLEFNETIMNAIMRGIARKIYNVIASI